MSPHPERILALVPVSRGLGVCVLDRGPALTVRAFVREVHEKLERRNAASLFEAKNLIDTYRPNVLVIEDHIGLRYKRKQRVSELLDLIAEHAAETGLPTEKLTREAVRASLSLPPNSSKDEVAEQVARRLPTMRRRLPRKKMAWDAERYGMGAFSAAALALSFMSKRSTIGTKGSPSDVVAPPTLL